MSCFEVKLALGVKKKKSQAKLLLVLHFRMIHDILLPWSAQHTKTETCHTLVPSMCLVYIVYGSNSVAIKIYEIFFFFSNKPCTSNGENDPEMPNQND